MDDYRGDRDPFDSVSGKPPCKQFTSTGSCSYGDSCRFSHVLEKRKPAKHYPNDSKARLLHQDWLASLSRQSTAIKKAWPKALEVLSGDHPEIHQVVAKDLVDDNALKLILLTTSIEATKPLSSSANLIKARDFLQVITHPALLDCLAVDSYIGTLYSFISGSNGTRAINYLAQIVTWLQNDYVPDSTDEHFSNGTEQMTSLMLTALLELLRRERRMFFNDDLPPLFASLHKFAKEMSSSELNNRVVAMKQMLQTATSNQSTPLQDILAKSTALTQPIFPMQLDGPGTRHGNDHENISDIKIFPTVDEILCNHTEYLPSTGFHRPHFLENTIQRYFDTQFRLLRHDIFGPLKDDLASLLRKLEAGMPQSNLAHQSGQARTYTYTDATIDRLYPNKKQGLQAKISFSAPRRLWAMTRREREQWWDRSPRLDEGGLVCFIAFTDKGPHVLFTTATAKDVRKEKDDVRSSLISDPPVVAVDLATHSPEDLQTMVQLFKDEVKGVLVDVPNLIPTTFMHILRNLQEMKEAGELAFARWVVPLDHTGKKDTHKRNPPPPAYAQKAGFSFSLESITSKELSITPTKPETINVAAVEKATGLDKGQAEGLVAALTREYALVQGPPGTGKSYLGVKLVQVLVSNRTQAQLGPIIVICYTNHALDQFLDHLISAKVSGIIRIGGQSRSHSLTSKNLRVVSQDTPRTRTESQELREAYGKLDSWPNQADAHLKTLDRAYGCQCGSWETLGPFLNREHPNIHERFLQLVKYDSELEYYEGYLRGVYTDPIEKWLGGNDTSNSKDATSLTSSNTELEIEDIIERAETDIHSLSQSERKALVKYWVQEVRDEAAEKLFLLTKNANEYRNRINAVHDEINRRTLLEASIIGLTTSGLARNLKVIKRLRSKVIICEEAGEVMEPYLVSAFMPGLEHFIQIGDHRQLRPQIRNHDLSLEGPRFQEYQLDRSQFERRAQGEPGMAPISVTQLNVQRRMRPDISKLIRQRIYPDLQDHESVKNLPDVVGMRENVFWLNHENLEDKAIDQHRMKSHSNVWEVTMTKALVQHFIRQGCYDPVDIAVLTPYTGQLQKLNILFSEEYDVIISDRDKKALAEDGFVCRNKTKTRKDDKSPADKDMPLVEKRTLMQSLRLATVDNFQGEEAKIVILSLVRSNPELKVGFLRTENRINVLVSRAKHGMYLIGNVDTYDNVPMWLDIHNQLLDMNAIGKSLPLCCPRHPETTISCATPDDFLRYAPDGGCALPCDRRLTLCGHKCPSKCHADTVHDAFVCLQPCARLRATCSHTCPKLCGNECGPCLVMVTVKLDCGHDAKMKCHELEDLASFKCGKLVKKTVPGCQHEVKVACNVDVTSKYFNCIISCAESLPCGHQCRGSCGKCQSANKHEFCHKICGRRFNTCSHTCPQPCHPGKECPPCMRDCEVKCSHSKCTLKCHDPCAPCIEPCNWGCPHQGTCSMPCAAPCDLLPCDKRCSFKLLCGHQCPSFCGEICPEGYCQVCNKERRNDRVDLLEFKEYHEIDLDETPIVVLGCGHFFVSETLDGLVGMESVYKKDAQTGFYNGLRDISYGQMAEGMPSCPDCKCRIRQFATKRYNRVINRAVMDESLKRFHLATNAKLEPLRGRLVGLGDELASSRQATIATLRDAPAKHSVLFNRWTVAQGLEKNIKNLRLRTLSEAYPLKRISDAVMYSHKVKEQEGPLNKPNIQATQTLPREQVSDHVLSLTARLLELMVQDVYLTDMCAILQGIGSKERPVSCTEIENCLKKHGLHCKGLDKFLSECTSFIEQAEGSKMPRLVIKGIICYARLSNWAQVAGVTIVSTLEEPVKDKRSDESQRYLETAKDLIERAFELVEQLGAPQDMQPLVEELQRLKEGTKYENVSAEELASIKLAMVSGSRGIATHSGHWYNCVNGHPFAIGECGMPMEEATCPECGAHIGGRNHRPVDGVTRAREMEDED